MAHIEIENLTFSYPSAGRPSLSNVSLTIRRGEYVVLCGKSGSGKSTLLNLVAGLESPTDGSINVLGQRIDRMSEIERIRFRRSHIGFVFQSYRLLPQYTAIENVALPLMLRGVEKRERERRALEALDMVGIAKCARQRPAQMSGGEQQRAGIARSIITSPAIVMADEPTGNLDSRTSQDVLSLLKVTSQKFAQTIVMITHNEEIAQTADRIIRIEDGRIVR